MVKDKFAKNCTCRCIDKSGDQTCSLTKSRPSTTGLASPSTDQVTADSDNLTTGISISKSLAGIEPLDPLYWMRTPWPKDLGEGVMDHIKIRDESTNVIIIIMIAFKGAIRVCFFLQSPHCVANRLQQVHSSGPGASLCKSRATHRAHITCNSC